MFCHKCGAQIPDDAVFCSKCGTAVATVTPKQAPPSNPVLAPSGAASMKCPNCGAPIAPKFGEMVITCEYCGSGVTLGSEGWVGIRKQTMLPLVYGDKDKITQEMRGIMDRGLFHRHLMEDSTLEDMNLSFIPYWIVSASARTSIITTNVAMQGAELATTAALIGVIGGGFGGGFGGRGGFGPRRRMFGAPMMAGFMGAGMGMGGGARESHELDNNYNFPIVALKALSEYQPKSYEFRLDQRQLFDVTKVPKGVKILNGDIGEDAAIYQAKTLVSQLQNEEAHRQYEMIQQLHTDVDVAETELLYAPIWFARYDHKGQKIVLVIDANSSAVINTLGI